MIFFQNHFKTKQMEKTHIYDLANTFLKLIKEYRKIIDLGYDKGTSNNYTPDWMWYDCKGFVEIYNNDDLGGNDRYDDIKYYLPKLKEAVAHARKYRNYLNSSYNYTFC